MLNRAGCLALLLTLLLWLQLPCSAAAETITLVADEWAPFNIKPDAQPEGYMVDIAREVFKKQGIEVAYKVVTWQRALEGTKNGEYTAAIGPTRLKAPYLIFPEEPLAINRLSFWVKKGNPWRYTGRDSINSVSLGLVEGYDYRQWLNTYALNNRHDLRKVQFVAGNTPLEMNLRKLVAGRIGAMVDNEATVIFTAAALGMLDKIQLAGKDYEPSYIFIGFSPKHPRSSEYARMLSEGIRDLRRNGRLQQLLAVYGLKDWK